MENFTNDMMDELLVKYLVDEATPPEQEAVEEWIGANAENKKYFEQFRLVWEESKSVAPGLAIDENKAWQRFQRRVRSSETIHAGERKIGQWRIAVAILLLLGIGGLIYGLVFKAPVEPAIINIASINQVKRDTLPDGSIATLNKHSELSYPKRFKGKTRNVRLRGEAFFNVQPNKEKPFIIDVNDVEVRVVGTSFNVRSDGGSTEIIVETGIVKVTKAGKSVELKAGERISLDAADVETGKEQSKDKLYNYYVSRTFECDNTPLWKLVDKLNEAYETKIRIARPELKKMPLTVTFNDESLDVILDIISQTFMIKVVKKDGEIVLE